VGNGNADRKGNTDSEEDYTLRWDIGWLDLKCDQSIDGEKKARRFQREKA
jgi:hypothetical protein